jgi:phage gp36-like protein
MAYLTLAELQTRMTAAELKRLTRTDPLDEPLVNAALDDASSAIDEFAAGTFGYPWAVVPTNAKDCCFDIVKYYLHQRAWPGTPSPLHISEPYNQAKAKLRELRDKKITWVNTNAPEIANKSSAFVSMPNDEPTYDSPRQARLGKLRKIF